MKLIYYIIHWTEDSDQCSVIKAEKTFNKKFACKLAIKMGGSVRRVVAKVESEHSEPLDFHELPNFCFDRDGKVLI